MSACDRWRDSLDAYVADMLDPNERVELERHLADCPACRRAVEASRQTWSDLDAWQDAPPPAGLADAALNRHASRGRIFRIAWPAVAAAGVALAFAAWSWYRPADRPTPAPLVHGGRQVEVSEADRAVIEHLDLLEEMPMLAEFDLVRRVDMLRTLDRLGLVEASAEEKRL